MSMAIIPKVKSGLMADEALQGSKSTNNMGTLFKNQLGQL